PLRHPLLAAACCLHYAAWLGGIGINISYQGPSAKAPFDIEPRVADDMLRTPLNVNGRPNSDVVRPVASAIDLVGSPRRRWTIDFDSMRLEEAVQYERPFEYVKEHVYPVRTQGRRAIYAGSWWQYGRPRPAMRIALQ